MLFFLLYLFIETIVSVNIASSLGGLNTFLEIIFSAFVGIVLFRQVGFSNVSKLQELRSGKLSGEEVARDSIFKLVGSLMLIMPGFFTDTLGVLFQFSFFSGFVADNFFKTKMKKRDNFNSRRYDDEKNSVIDVEVVDDNDFDDKSIGK